MRLRIDGRDYPAVNHKGASLLHVLQLKREAKAVLGYPLGLRELDRMAKAAEKLKRDIAAARKAGDDDRVAELQAEAADDGMIGLALVIYFSRRKAGEALTFAEAIDVDLGAVQYIREDGDPDDDEDDADEGAPDPTSPGSASPATAGTRARGRSAAAKAAPRKASTGGRSTPTTSRSRSGTG